MTARGDVGVCGDDECLLSSLELMLHLLLMEGLAPAALSGNAWSDGDNKLSLAAPHIETARGKRRLNSLDSPAHAARGGVKGSVEISG
jgi:hypothetical protein